jgi:glutathione synthase/RimK-type ligase-like ATP-grasp enzyme
MNKKQRQTVLTRGINNEFIKKYNDPKFTHIFQNKNEFNTYFKKFIKRDWILLSGDNEDEFNKFIKDKKEIIIKPIDGTHGDGVRKIKPDKNTYKSLILEMPIIAEDVMNKLKK